MRIETFTHDGLDFDVVDEGPLDGPVVLLLHGFPERATSWSQVTSILNERGFRTLAPDQRGYSPGARPPRRRDYRVEALARDVVALIEQLSTSVHIVGHDWGANIAWRVAIDRPDLVLSLTAFSVPHPSGFLRAMFSSRQLFMSWYFAFFQLPVLPERWLTQRGGAGGRWQSRGGMTAEEQDRCRREIVDYGALRGAVNWYRGLMFSGPSTLRGRVRVPTTMVWSDGDTFIGKSAVERAEQYVDAPYELIVLADVTHWIPTQEAEQAAAAITGRAESISK